MKKGVLALTISLLIGVGYLLIYFNIYRPVFSTAPYQVLNTTIDLPRLVLPQNMILVVLGVILNLCAIVSYQSSLAAGAAVMYGVSIGLLPDSYPYAVIEFALCLIGAMRMKERRDEKKADPLEPKRPRLSSSLYVVNEEPDLPKSAPVIRTLNGKPLEQNKSETDSRRDASLIRIVCIICLLIVALTALRSFFQAKKERTESEKTSQVFVGPDLSGYYRTDENGSGGMEAQIEDGSITVYWLSADGTKQLYWAGSYEAPTSFDQPYIWMSSADQKKMEGEAFASKDGSKIFTYQNDTISFRASVFGKLEMTYRLHKEGSE